MNTKEILDVLHDVETFLDKVSEELTDLDLEECNRLLEQIGFVIYHTGYQRSTTPHTKIGLHREHHD